MLKINKVKATEEFLKIYLLKLHEIGFLKCLNFKDDIFNALLRFKSFKEINSKELFDCCPNVFTDFIPEFLYYVSDLEIPFKNVFEFPVLYASIEKLGDNPFFEARYGLFAQTGCDIYNIEGKILKSIHPESLYDDDIISDEGKYQINIDSDRNFLMIDEFLMPYYRWFREIYYIEDDRIVDINEMTDLTIIVDAIQKHGRSFLFTSKALQDNKEVVLAAVKKDGSSLMSASENLINDKEIVLVAVKNDSFSLEFASENLRNDKEVVLTAVLNNGYTLIYASENLKNDKDVVLAAVENYWPALKFASEELQLDKDIQNCVTQCLRDTVEHLNYLEHRDRKCYGDEVSDDYEQEYNNISNKINHLLRLENCIHLKDDQDFMIKILTVLYRCNSEFNIVFNLASEKLLQSKQFLHDLLNEPDVFYFEGIYKGINEEWNKFPSSFWLDEDCVLTILNHSVDSFKYASEELKSNRDFVLKAVNIKGAVLKYVSTEFKSDKEIVMDAIKNNSSAFQFASPLLQGDKEIIDLKEKEERENELPF